MTTRYIRRFFAPESIAVIGASERSPSLGETVLRNILDAGFPGTLSAVNPRGADTILGVPRFGSVEALPETPDLAVICTPAATIPQLVDELGRNSVRAVLIVMGGLSSPVGSGQGVLGQAIGFAHNLLGLRLESGKTLKEATWEAARPYDLRIMGPNCIGVVAPAKRLNASYAHCMVPTGEIAYVGQSGMLGLAVMDWVQGRGLGLSYLTTLGDSIDIDIADVIDYLEDDRGTRAIALHVEEIRAARRFMSALRAAARRKLVLVLKSRRLPESQQPPEPVAPGLTSGDLVYDAALRRAGVLRVERADEIFNVVTSLSRMRGLHGERLVIVCNGIGPAWLAADHLLLGGGKLAKLSEDTVEAIQAQMPPFWSPGNPVDLHADATPERYVQAIEQLAADPGVDAVLVLHVPTLAAPSLATAEAVIALALNAHKPVLTSWLGYASAQAARTALDAAGISTFDTPEQAIDAFLHMARYRQNQHELAQTPSRPKPGEPSCDGPKAWALVGEALNTGRTLLTDEEAMGMLAAAAIPVAHPRYASDLVNLRQLASELEPPYALKILTDATRRPFAEATAGNSAWHGVARDLGSLEALEAAATALAAAAQEGTPDRRYDGFRLQHLARGIDALQLSMGITRDRVFGPLVFFGAGGHPTSALADRRVGLPPLNLPLAKLLIDSTIAGRALADASTQPARDRNALAGMLVRLGQLVVEVPAIAGLEINPLMVNQHSIVALDIRIALGEPAETALTPYPSDLEDIATLPRSGRKILLRPIRGEDAPAHAAFVSRLSPQAIRFRFFQPRSSFTRIELAQFTQIDYAREMAFIATTSNSEGQAETLGVVRAWIDADNVSAEFAVIVDDACRGESLGRLLTEKMMDYARSRGILLLRGSVLTDNQPMLRLARKLGFRIRMNRDDDTIEIALPLNEPADDWQRERLARL